MEAEPAIGICGATVVYADDPDCIQTLGGGSIDRKGRIKQLGQGRALVPGEDAAEVESRLNYVNGACAFVRRSFIEQIGPMSEDYFLYFEELDWAMRGKDRFQLGYCQHAVVHHHVGKSIGTSDSGQRSMLSAYYLTANYIRFCSRHLRGALPYVIVEKLREIARLLRQGRWHEAAVVICGLALISPATVRRMRLL
jgi:GT2 family glycosyltransferase